MKSLTARLSKLNIFEEILEEERDFQIIEETVNEEERVMQTSLLKIPKYLETVRNSYYSLSRKLIYF